MKIVGVVQARLGSTRLPRKVLEPLSGETSVLRFLLGRLTRSHYLDRIVVAVPPGDIVEFVAARCRPDRDPVPIGLHSYDVPDDDLVARHAAVAREFDADLIVRVPSDNPFVDPWWVDVAIHAALSGRAMLIDTLSIDYPARPLLAGDAIDGLGAEVYSRALIETMDNDNRGQREHPRALADHFVSPPSMFESLGRTWRHGPVHLDVNDPADLDRMRRIASFCVEKWGPHFSARNLNSCPHEVLA